MRVTKMFRRTSSFQHARKTAGKYRKCALSLKPLNQQFGHTRCRSFSVETTFNSSNASYSPDAAISYFWFCPTKKGTLHGLILKKRCSCVSDFQRSKQTSNEAFVAVMESWPWSSENSVRVHIDFVEKWQTFLIFVWLFCQQQIKSLERTSYLSAKMLKKNYVIFI